MAAAEPEPPARIGQRPGARGVLTEDVQDRCVQALRGCAYVKDACAFAGIAERRYHEWVQRGYDYDAHLEAGGEIIEGADVYRRFALAVDQARAEARIGASSELRRAWQDGDWRAALAFLERSDPQHWGRVNRVEMTGREGGPIEVDVTAVEQRLAQSLQSRPLVVDAQVIEEVGKVVPAAAAALPTSDDDDEDYYLLPYADLGVYGEDGFD